VLEKKGAEWEIPTMHAVKVDDARRIRLKVLKPGDYYAPEFINADEITLRRVQPPKRAVKLTKTQALKAIRKSKLTFSRSWETIRQETRDL
jgi:hypothetical protein